MKLHSRSLRSFRFLAMLLFVIPFLTGTASAQQATTTKKDAPTRSKYPAAKAQASSVAEEDADAESTTFDKKPEKDSPDTIRKREEWFHKQRASANGHIPAGAHRQALEHMNGMMEREGKLVRLPNGTVQEVAPREVATFGNPVSTNWLPIGPSPTSGGFFSPVTGRITTIAIDPSDAAGNTVLIGGAQGGIWRTTDGGTTWTAVGDQNVSLAMGSIAFAPSSATTVYAGTGEQASIGADIYYGEGVLKSTNGGQTWTQTCTTPSASCPFIGPFNDVTPFEFFTLGGARISYISVNPANPQLVLAGAQFALSGSAEGVYCSADGGATWSNVLPGQMSTFVGFASSTVAFAALGDPFGSTSGANLNGIYKSINANSVTAGACSMTFTPVTGATLPASSSMGRIDLGISPNFATDNTIYASIASSASQSSTNLGVWVTTNGGTSWIQTAAPDICQQQCWYDNVIKVDPSNKDVAFFGGSSVTSAGSNAWVLRSASGTTAAGTWTSVIPNLAGGSAGLPHVDNHAIAMIKLASGKVRLYLGNDGGIWRTDDAENASVTWTNLNGSALQLTQFYPDLSVHPSSPNFAFAGAQDNGSQIYAGTNNWTDNQTCGDGTGTAIDNVFPSTVYVTCNGNNIAVSTTNGTANSFLGATNGINPADNADFVPPLVTDPSTANVVYTGTTKVYQSVNTGNSWVALSADLVNGASFHNLTAMAVAPGNPAVVYAGADTGGVFVATNVAAGTGTFAAVTGQASLPGRRVMGIAVDPADTTGKTAYVAFSGFAFTSANDLIGHLFKTTDGGATWKDVSCTVANCTTPAGTDLPNTPVNTVVVDPNAAGVLYVGTDIGVFEGMCTTTCTWSTLSTGLPRVAVLSLKLHAPSRTLIAATHGRGAWNFLLSNFPFPGPHISSLSVVSAVAGGAGFTLTVTGNGLTGGAIQFAAVALTPTGTQSDTSLSGTVLASSIAGGGAIPVTVKVGANTSNALTFTVLGGAPTISIPVSPASAAVNAAATQITVTGTNFSNSSVVLMNPDGGGTPIPTTFVSSTSLHATVPATFMAGFGGTNSVGVQNPPPGGGTTVTTNTVTLPTFVVTAPAPTNDNFINALTVTPGAGGVFADTKDSSAATTEANDPTPPCVIVTGAGRANTIWYKFTPASSGTITDVDTIGSSYDTVLSVWTGASLATLVAVANGCNDDINSGIVIQSQLTNLSVTAGTTYYFMVSSFGPADPNPVALGGKSVFNLTFAGASGGSYSLSGSTATATAGGSGTSTITLTPAGGFTGPVAITCGTAVPGVTCGALNVTVPSGGANGTGTLTINVTAPSTALSAMNVSKPEGFLSASIPSGRSTNSRGWWALSGVTGVAAVLLLFLPGRKRYRLAVSLGLVCLFTFALGCSNNYGGGGGGGGPVATTTTLTVSSTKQAANGSLTVSATVTATGRTPGGTVTFSADGTALGTAVSLTNGSTGQITVTAAQAPAFLTLVGTHAVKAAYSGDAYTSASTSATLNISITGPTQLPISGSPAASNANATVALTIN